MIGDTILNSIFTNKEELGRDVKVRAGLSYTNHELVELRILRTENIAYSKMTMLDFRRANFGFFRDLLGRTQRISSWIEHGYSWLIFKDNLLQTQEWSFPMSRKSSTGGKTHMQMKKELLTNFSH